MDVLSPNWVEHIYTLVNSGFGSSYAGPVKIALLQRCVESNERAVAIFEEICSTFLVSSAELGPDTVLLFFMCYFPFFKATEAKDLVYSFLGIANIMLDNAQMPNCTIHTNYSKELTAAEVFKSVILAVLAETAAPIHLSMLVDTSLRGREGLPS